MEQFLQSAWEAFLGFLPRLIGAALVMLGGWLLNYIAKRVLNNILKKKVEPLMHMFIRNSVKIVIWVLAVIMAMGELGLSTASIITALGSAGVAIGLALQGSLSNIASGLILMGSKVLKGGDYISVNGVEGTVVSTDLLFTHLNTVDNKHIAVPNSGITAGNIINYTYNDTRRVDMEFTVSYNDDIGKVKSILRDICGATEGVLHDPEYSVNVKSYDDSAVRMTVKVWCKRNDYWDVYFAVTEKVKGEFDRNGISIPFNQIDVHFFPPADNGGASK